jgi:hypothetical protein
MIPTELQKYLKISVIPIRVGNQFALCDINKNIISRIRYDYISPFQDGYAIFGIIQFEKSNLLYGLISETGTVILNTQYLKIIRLKSIPSRVILVNKLSSDLYDTTKNKILYKGAKSFGGSNLNYIIVNKGSHHSFEGEAGGQIEIDYDGENYGIIDFDGNVILNPQFNLLDYPCNGILRANNYGSLYEYMDIKYADDLIFGGPFKIPIGGYSYYIDINGNFNFSKTYKFCWNFNEGIARVLVDGEFEVIEDYNIPMLNLKNPIYSYINEREEILYTTEKNCTAYNFKNGKAEILTSDKKTKWLIKDGNQLIEQNPIIETTKQKWKNDFFKCLYTSNGFQLIDLKLGKEVLTCNDCENVVFASKELIYKIKKNENGSIDLSLLKYKNQDSFINLCSFNNIDTYEIKDNLLFVSINEKKGVFLLDGSQIIPVEYNRIQFESGMLGVYEKTGYNKYSLMGYYTILGIKYF